MKKTLITISILLLLLPFLFVACDKIEEPYLKEGASNWTFGRNVLLEEFTGHKCPNCPEASFEAHELQKEHSELILISVHAGTFATPNASGIFNTDFRCETGNELESYFNPSFYPSGLVNRKAFGSNMVLNFANWTQAVTEFSDLEPVADLTVVNSYDSATRTINAVVTTEFKKKYFYPVNITLYLTEDSIVKPQYNDNSQIGNTPYILDYTHRNVLRGSFNGTWGSPLTTQTVTAGTIKTSNHTMVLDTVWNDRQCRIVAFITDKNTKEVLQVTEKKVR